MGSADFLQTLNQRLTDYARELQVSQRVLVVDDEPSIQVVLSEFLAGNNIEADVVSTAEAGIEKLNENDYAVLITDKNLPGMSGITLLHQVKDQLPQVEVIVITGYASSESALEAIGAGAYDYIPKPLPGLDYLTEKVRGALARHDYEVRIHAMIAYLSSTLKSMLADLKVDVQAEWILKLKEVLASHRSTEGTAQVLVQGPRALAKLVEEVGHQATRVDDLEEAASEALAQDFRVLVIHEEDGNLDAAEVVRKFRAACPDLGVFIIARESSLNRIVNAIGAGVGDYLVRPLEGRELFGPRLTRLIARQQRIVRYRRLLEALKGLSIDLQTSCK